MPRKPKLEKKTVQVVLDGTPVAVALHPPTGGRKSWYAYWAGLVASRSTGQADFGQAVAAAEHMVRAWKAGRDSGRPQPANILLTDEEFEQVQRAHYGRKGDPRARRRAAKSLVSCLEAIRAFREVTGLSPVTAATPDDCATFQRKALALPRNWRCKHPNSRPQPGTLSPSTVAKWTVALAAAFERVNRNAGKKCVRGVVDAAKLLEANPWRQITPVEGRERPMRRFDAAELTGLLSYLELYWPAVSIARAVAKVFLWSGCRREEISSLTWPQARPLVKEYHFEVEGKHGVRRWFRLPQGLYQELESLRVDGSDYVFAAYNVQLRSHYERSPRPGTAKVVGDSFSPVCLGDWFYERVKAWARTLPKGDAYIHVFRKTALQFARIGEDVNRRVAEDARVSEGVLLGHYVTEEDAQLRAKSNRTFERLAAALPADLAAQYGHTPADADPLEERLQAATRAGDWPLVARLASELEHKRRSSAG